MTTPDRDELQRRNQLAHAILTQRDPNPTTITLALCALDGVPVDLLVKRHHHATAGPITVDWPQLVTDLRHTCHTRGISQRALAIAIGVSRNTIRHLLRGHPLTADHLAALVVWLYPEDQTPRWTTREVVRGA